MEALNTVQESQWHSANLKEYKYHQEQPLSENPMEEWGELDMKEQSVSGEILADWCGWS